MSSSIAASAARADVAVVAHHHARERRQRIAVAVVEQDARAALRDAQHTGLRRAEADLELVARRSGVAVGELLEDAFLEALEAPDLGAAGVRELAPTLREEVGERAARDVRANDGQELVGRQPAHRGPGRRLGLRHAHEVLHQPQVDAGERFVAVQHRPVPQDRVARPAPARGLALPRLAARRRPAFEHRPHGAEDLLHLPDDGCLPTQLRRVDPRLPRQRVRQVGIEDEARARDPLELLARHRAARLDVRPRLCDHRAGDGGGALIAEPQRAQEVEERRLDGTRPADRHRLDGGLGRLRNLLASEEPRARGRPAAVLECHLQRTARGAIACRPLQSENLHGQRGKHRPRQRGRGATRLRLRPGLIVDRLDERVLSRSAQAVQFNRRQRSNERDVAARRDAMARLSRRP